MIRTLSYNVLNPFDMYTRVSWKVGGIATQIQNRDVIIWLVLVITKLQLFIVQKFSVSRS